MNEARTVEVGGKEIPDDVRNNVVLIAWDEAEKLVLKPLKRQMMKFEIDEKNVRFYEGSKEGKVSVFFTATPGYNRIEFDSLLLYRTLSSVNSGNEIEANLVYEKAKKPQVFLTFMVRDIGI